MEGATLFDGKHVPRPAVGIPTGSTNKGQVSDGLLSLLGFDGLRPIWDKPVMAHLLSLKSLSVPHYPHSAEDLRLAYDTFPPDRYNVVGVWSSISPWVELGLLNWGVERVITVDYNPPIIVNTPEITSMSVDADIIGPNKFDMIVSFSGIEHDGLGRYGDPIQPNGDMRAMRDFFYYLRPGGVLFLAVPTCMQDDVVFPWHRMYGPIRLPRLIANFDLLGHVWDGKVVRGAELDRLYGAKPGDWQHQPVMVLRKPISQT
jgi:SAM-dependent methyltransferase